MGISKWYVSEPRSHRPARNLPDHKPNILVDNNGRGCLAGFGQVTIASDWSTDISSFSGAGTIQWMSPELLNPEHFNMEGHPTKDSDCYALGMVIYEVLSGRAPFVPSNAPVIWMVLNGQRPERPKGREGALFTDDLWEILGLCWKQQPGERTSAKAVLRCLEKASSLPRLHPDRIGIMETSVGEQLDATTSGSSMLSLFHQRSQADHQFPTVVSQDQQPHIVVVDP